MKEKSSFTTEKSIDYTKFKDTYDGNRKTASYEKAAAHLQNVQIKARTWRIVGLMLSILLFRTFA